MGTERLSEGEKDYDKSWSSSSPPRLVQSWEEKKMIADYVFFECIASLLHNHHKNDSNHKILDCDCDSYVTQGKSQATQRNNKKPEGVFSTRTYTIAVYHITGERSWSHPSRCITAFSPCSCFCGNWMVNKPKKYVLTWALPQHTIQFTRKKFYFVCRKNVMYFIDVTFSWWFRLLRLRRCFFFLQFSPKVTSS